MKHISIITLLIALNFFQVFAQNIDTLLVTGPLVNKVFIETDNKTKPGIEVLKSDFNQGAIFSPLQLIQGKVPGFNINNLSALDPNPDLEIQIRGYSYYFDDREPLYLLDGVPITSSEIVPVQNIESIIVLRKVSETAPFGMLGSNGVVLIKTRKNSEKRFNLAYNTYTSIEIFAKKNEMMSANEWRSFKDKLSESEFPHLSEFWSYDEWTNTKDYGSDTDWRNTITQNTISHSQHISCYGKIGKTSYSTDLQFNNNNGKIQKTGNKTMSGQIAISQLALKDKLKIDLSLISTEKVFNKINGHPFLSSYNSIIGKAEGNIISTTNTYNPTVPLSGVSQNGEFNLTSGIHLNPLNLIYFTGDNHTLTKSSINVKASYRLFNGLTLSGFYSKQNSSQEDYYWLNHKHISISLRTYKEKIELIKEIEDFSDVMLDYRKSFGKHHLQTRLSLTNYNYNSDFEEFDTTSTAFAGISSSRLWSESYYSVSDLLASFDYNYAHKYYFSFNLLSELQIDNFNEFEEQLIPSFSLAWAVGNENFLSSFNWLNSLILHYDYGQYQYQKIRNLASTSPIINNPATYYLTKQEEQNFGLEFSAFSNKINFAFEHYNRKTNNTQDSVTYINSGWEYALTYNYVSKLLKWNSHLALSLNKHQIKSNYYGANYASFGNITGYEFAGFSDTDMLLVFDENGNPVELQQGEEKIIGNALPSSFLGFTNYFYCKNFDLSISIRGAFGFDIKNHIKIFQYYKMNHRKEEVNLDERVFAWTNRLDETDYFIEKGDYLKIDNISIGYTLPMKDRLVKSTRFYLACNNLAMFTKSTVEDPEMAGINGLFPGNFYFPNYYRTRIFLLGLNVGF